MNDDYIKGLRRAQQIARMTYKGSVVADKIEVEITAMALRSEQQRDKGFLPSGKKHSKKLVRITLKRLTFKDLLPFFRRFLGVV